MPSCGCCDIEACCCTVRPPDTMTWRPSLSSHGFYLFFMVSLFLQYQPSLGSAQSVLFFPELQWQWEDGRRRRRREEEENKHHIGGSEEGGTNWEGAVSSFSTEQHTSKKVRTNHNLVLICSHGFVSFDLCKQQIGEESKGLRLFYREEPALIMGWALHNAQPTWNVPGFFCIFIPLRGNIVFFLTLPVPCRWIRM